MPRKAVRPHPLPTAPLGARASGGCDRTSRPRPRPTTCPTPAALPDADRLRALRSGLRQPEDPGLRLECAREHPVTLAREAYARASAGRRRHEVRHGALEHRSRDVVGAVERARYDREWPGHAAKLVEALIHLAQVARSELVAGRNQRTVHTWQVVGIRRNREVAEQLAKRLSSLSLDVLDARQ